MQKKSGYSRMQNESDAKKSDAKNYSNAMTRVNEKNFKKADQFHLVCGLTDKFELNLDL